MKINIPSYNEIIDATENYLDVHDDVFISGLESDDQYVKWYAIKGCGLKKIKTSIPKLVEILATPCISFGNTDIRRISAWALAQFDFELLQPVIENVDKSNVLLIEGLCDALGILCDLRGLKYIDDFLNINDNNIYLWGSLSLSKIGEDSISIIQKHIESQNSSLSQKIYLLDALKKINSTESNIILEKYLNEEKFSKIKDFFLK